MAFHVEKRQIFENQKRNMVHNKFSDVLMGAKLWMENKISLTDLTELTDVTQNVPGRN